MNLVRPAISSVAALLIAATIASAQSGGMPAGGTGTGGTGTGTGGAPTNLDLPLDKPAFVGDPNKDKPPPAGDPVPEDDPRDEPPPTIYGEEIDTETDTIVYVIDISCSMDWDNQSYTTLDGRRANGPRIDRAKAELSRSIMGLSRNFKFSCVAFSCSTRVWQQQLQEANDANKSSALAWVRGLNPTDATGTAPGVALGLSLDRQNKQVVLLTDGAPNCGASPQNESGHRNAIRNANTQRASITVFGIAAYGTYRTFCQNVASDSGGSYFDVP
jgi:hypothetical protein